MKILIVGSGGREHALAWKCAQSENVTHVFVAPGNGGTAVEAKCENVPLSADPVSAAGQEELKQFALKEKIDITIIGPEAPLAAGIADTFRDAFLAVIGPGKEAARLESSKVYSKAFMAKYGVQAPKSSDFTDPEKARAFAAEHFGTAGAPGNKTATPLVVKADGLAAGKGVVIAKNMAEAEAAINSFMRDKTLGEAGSLVLLEEFLEGREISILAGVCITKDTPGYIQPFIPARDHKSRFEGGRGPNTGGMGAIAPVPDFSPAARADFMKSIVKPTLKGIRDEGMDYRGFIFFGLMVRDDRCYLLEYNVRLGDPETQAVLPLMDFDLEDYCSYLLLGKGFPTSWKPGSICAPVAVAEGYPGPYRKGDIINIDAAALKKTGSKVFISGAVSANGGSGETPALQTSGGRVLTVSAYGENADEARANAVKGLEAVKFEGMGYRTDIGE